MQLFPEVLLRYSKPLQPAVLIRRYQRFLADVELPDGSMMTVHVPNTGSLMGCRDPGLKVWLLDSENPERKYRFTWEQVEVGPGNRVGINTHRANALVEEALEAGLIPELRQYAHRRAEVRFGSENSRVDWLLSAPEQPDFYLEVKNVTTALGQGVAAFPDAVTARGTKHLRELMRMVDAGHRAGVLFCVQRDDCHEVIPADQIDPLYGATLREARTKGVEFFALAAQLSSESVELFRPLSVNCPPH
jgi:sugar fermentation stimulation protein A